MTIDDAAAILDVTEGQVKDLIRDGDLAGARGGYIPGTVARHYPKPLERRPPKLQAGEWWVDGQDVRARKRALAKARSSR